MVTPLANGAFRVKSATKDGLEYIVRPGIGCTCPDATFRKRVCRHMKEVDAQIKAERLAAKAAALTPAELTALLPRYADRPEVAAAIKGALAGRWTSRKLSGPNSDAEAFGGV
jgi:hypothetical protein